MRDADFTKLLRRLAKAHNKYLDLLNDAELEYERRIGTNPSNINDDQWIDNFHICRSNEYIDCKQVVSDGKHALETTRHNNTFNDDRI